VDSKTENYDWFLEKADITRTLLATVKARKMRYFGHIMRSNGSNLETEIIQGTLLGRRRRRGPQISLMDNVQTWTGLETGMLPRAAVDRLQWRLVAHGAANPRIEDG